VVLAELLQIMVLVVQVGVVVEVQHIQEEMAALLENGLVLAVVVRVVQMEMVARVENMVRAM
jgi:hypothetical protein